MARKSLGQTEREGVEGGGLDMPVRAATPDDCAAIARLNEVVQQHHADALPDLFKPASAGGLPESRILDLMRRDGVFIALAEMDGNAAGYVYAEVVRRPDSAQRYAMDLIYIHHIAVLPALQGRGVGRDLVDHVKSRARTENIATVRADIWSFNEGARSFFRSCGLSTINETMSVDL